MATVICWDCGISVECNSTKRRRCDRCRTDHHRTSNAKRVKEKRANDPEWRRRLNKARRDKYKLKGGRHLLPEQRRTGPSASAVRAEALTKKRSDMASRGLCDCSECGRVMPFDMFSKSGASQHTCRDCASRRTMGAYYSKTPEKRRADGRKWWSTMTENPTTKQYYMLRRRMASRINHALKGSKACSAMLPRLIGCSIGQLRRYLEVQFDGGMTWENHSIDGWHIDHVIPLASFDYNDAAQQKEAWHYSNLRPLWAKENRIKHAKRIPQYQPNLLGL